MTSAQDESRFTDDEIERMLQELSTYKNFEA